MDVGYSIEDSNKNVKYCHTLSGVDYIGDFYVLFNMQSNYFFKANTDVNAFGLNKNKFVKILLKYPSIYEKFRTISFRRNNDIRSQIEKLFNLEIKILNSVTKNLKIIKPFLIDVKYFI